MSLLSPVARRIPPWPHCAGELLFLCSNPRGAGYGSTDFKFAFKSHLVAKGNCCLGWGWQLGCLSSGWGKVAVAPQLERNCTRGLWPDISHSRGFESLCEKRRLEREKERLPGTALLGAPPGRVSPWRPRSAPAPERQLSQPRVQRGQELPDTHTEDRDAAKPPVGVLTPQRGLSKLHGTGRDLAHGAQVPQVRRETQASPQGAGGSRKIMATEASGQGLSETAGSQASLRSTVIHQIQRSKDQTEH